jgi:hypothetical protein
VRGLVKSAPAAANSFIASASALIGRITPKRISRGRTVMPNPLAGEVGASVTGKALWSPEIDVPTGRAPLFQSIKSHPSVKHSCGGAARRRLRDELLQRDTLSSLPRPAPYWRLGWRIAITMCAPAFWACQQDTVGVPRRAYCRGGKRHKHTRLQPRTLLMIGGKEGLVSVPIESVPIPGSSSSDHQHG